MVLARLVATLGILVVVGTVACLLALTVLALARLVALFAFIIIMRTVALGTLLVTAMLRLVATMAVGIEARTVSTLRPTESFLCLVVTPVRRICALRLYARTHRPVSTLIVKAFCLPVAVTANFVLSCRQTLVHVFQFF